MLLNESKKVNKTIFRIYLRDTKKCISHAYVGRDVYITITKAIETRFLIFLDWNYYQAEGIDRKSRNI